VGRRALIFLLIALAAALSLSSCGADEVSDATAADVARAAERTAKAGGAAFTVNGTTTGPQATIALAGDGVQDERGNAEIEFEVSAAGEKATMRQVIAGEEIFMSSDLFKEDLPDDKEWIKIDLRRVAGDLGLENAPQTSGTDPRESLRNLRAVGDVETVGTEEVRGVETTHFKATVEVRRLPELVEPSERSAARRAVDRLIKLTGNDVQKTEVWVDDRDYVRRIREQFSMKGPGDEQLENDITIEYSDFGKRVSIEVPAESEALDATELAAQEARKQSKTN
jgi:hypothetical protein